MYQVDQSPGVHNSPEPLRVRPSRLLSFAETRRITKKLKRYITYKIFTSACLVSSATLLVFTSSRTIMVISLIIVLAALILFFILDDKINKTHEERAKASIAEALNNTNSIMNALNDKRGGTGESE